MAKLLALATVISIFSTGLCSSCSNLEVASKSYTTVDATIVSNIAYIAEFSVKCGSGQPGFLYAEVNGNLVPVSTLEPNKYQVNTILNNIVTYTTVPYVNIQTYHTFIPSYNYWIEYVSW